MSEWGKDSGVDSEKAKKFQKGFAQSGNTDIVGNLKSAWLGIKSAFDDKDKKPKQEQDE